MRAINLYEKVRDKQIWKILRYIMPVCMMIAVYFCTSRLGAVHANKDNDVTTVVIIDAGHGGVDPGKVATNGALEKDINLQIAHKLRESLESQDIQVIMTRENDNGLYKEEDKNKKVSDMRARCDMINMCDAKLLISIHQNSYSSEAVYGSQIFYYTHSNEGKKVAEILQKSLNSGLKNGSERVAKANESYYLLLNVKCPAVIAECGFLSNRKEASLLCESDYQNKIVYCLMQGIMQYLNNE